jgi:TRAP-type C4-dicarboxylate transport system substrate-binding protein
MKEMKAGAEQIKQRTEGRVKLKFYPGGVMGNDKSVHRKIKIGQLQGGAFTPGGLAQVNPSIQALGLPMMFDTYAEVDYVRAKMDPIMRQEMEASGFVIRCIYRLANRVNRNCRSQSNRGYSLSMAYQCVVYDRDPDYVPDWSVSGAEKGI